MQKEWVLVRAGGKTLDCDTVILVDDRALEEDGFITMLSSNSGSQTKHAFYALAQMALIQFQDDGRQASTRLLQVWPSAEPVPGRYLFWLIPICQGASSLRQPTDSVPAGSDWM